MQYMVCELQISNIEQFEIIISCLMTLKYLNKIISIMLKVLGQNIILLKTRTRI